MAPRVRVGVGILCAWSILGGCALPTARAAFPSQIVVAGTADNELTAQTERWAADQLSSLMALPIGGLCSSIAVGYDASVALGLLPEDLDG